MEPAIEQLLGLTPQSQSSPRPSNVQHNSSSSSLSAFSPPTSSSSSFSSSSPSLRPAPVSPEIAASFTIPHVRSPIQTVPSTSSSSYPPQYPVQQRGTKRWRHVLPPDFLTLPYEVIVIASNQAAVAQHPSANSLPLTQLEGDEALASMLQNENFLEQLQSDPEFAAFLIQNPRVARQLGIDASQIPQPSLGDLKQQQQQEQQRKSRQRLNSLEIGDDKLHSKQKGGSSGAGAPGAASHEWDIGTGLSSMGSSMKRRMGLIAARFRRQNAAPPTSASSSFASSSLPHASSSTSSSFTSGARGLMSHVSSFFDGKGAYSSLPHSTSADLKLDDDVQPPRPNSAGAPDRSERVRKMGGAISPSSPPFGSSKFTGGGKNNNLGSPIGIGMVDLDLSDGGSINGDGSGGGGGRGFVAKPTPKQRTFDLQDEEDEDENNSETTSLTKSGSKRI
jgi:hypothetical protein